LARYLFLLYFFSSSPLPPRSPLFPYTTLFRSSETGHVPCGRLVLLLVPFLPANPAVQPTASGADPAFTRARTGAWLDAGARFRIDRKSTRLNSSHLGISYAVFCLKKKKTEITY